MHGFCRARIEHLFACMWHWGIVRIIRIGSGTEFHECVCVLLHFFFYKFSQNFLTPCTCLRDGICEAIQAPQAR